MQTVKAMPKGLPERMMIINAYADSLKVVWAVMAGLAFMALGLSCATEGLNLNSQQITEQGLRDEKSESGSENEACTQ